MVFQAKTEFQARQATLVIRELLAILVFLARLARQEHQGLLERQVTPEKTARAVILEFQVKAALRVRPERQVTVETALQAIRAILGPRVSPARAATRE